MKWVKNFYEKQYSLFEADRPETGIDSYHRDLVSKLEKHAHHPLNTMLELGAGTGEVAMAAAQKGYDVTAVELVPKLVNKMKEIQTNDRFKGNFTPICGDFYDIEHRITYDLVYYLDGFGVGSDHDQKRLLHRINNWLKPDGCALIDIYTPWYWSKHAGQEMHFNRFSRKYDYDFIAARMLDTMWSNSTPESITQTLRCYTPADLNMLLENTGLKMVDIIPGGSFNYKTWEYKEQVSLDESMSYMAKLEKI